jgi:hypothetical protein
MSTNATLTEERSPMTSRIGVDGDGNEHRWNHATGRVEVTRHDGTTAYDLGRLGVGGLEEWRQEVAARAGAWERWDHDKTTADLLREVL